jgi:sugar phosphate isomerase/epimerase
MEKMNKIIIIVNDIDNISKLKEIILQYPNSKIFSLNYFTHNKLIKNSIEHEMGDNYLTNIDKNIIDTKTIETASNWYLNNNFKNSLMFDGINLASLIEMESFDYFSKVYKNTLTIIRIIEKEKPTTLVDITDYNDLIQNLCNSKKIDYVQIHDIRQASTYFDKINIKYNIGSIPLSITISKNNYQKIKDFIEKITKQFLKLNKNFNPQKKSILLLDFNTIQYNLLLKELSNSSKNILLLNQRRPAVWNLESYNIMRKLGSNIISLNDFNKKIEHKIKQEQQQKKNELKSMWNNDLIFNEVFKIENYCIWNSIKDSFTKICNTRFLDSVERLMLLQQLFTKYDISVILEWAETAPHEKEVVHVAKRYGKKIVMLQHGMSTSGDIWDRAARFFSFFSGPLNSDKQVVWGNITKEYAIKYGHNPENIISLGSPRHDKFFQAKKINSKGMILLATTGVSEFFAETSTTNDYLKFNDFIREVCRVVKNLKDKKLVIKPHPQSDFVNNIINLIKEIDPQIEIVLDTDLVELINSCEMLITFNNSTIALESMILNKPTISLQTDKWAEENEIVKKHGILSISKLEDIEPSIHSILKDDVFKINMLKNSNNFIQKYYTNRGDASTSLAQFLENF